MEDRADALRAAIDNLKGAIKAHKKGDVEQAHSHATRAVDNIVAFIRDLISG